jgi:hypothetical protein
MDTRREKQVPLPQELQEEFQSAVFSQQCHISSVCFGVLELFGNIFRIENICAPRKKSVCRP